MTRIVDPILADMRWEDERASLRGYATLFKALALHGITSLPGWCTAVWSDDTHAMAKAAGFVTATTLLATVPLMAPPLLHVPRLNVSPLTFVVTLLPQALALTLPASLLVAIPLALRGIHISGRLIRRTLLLSTAVAAANSAVVVYAVPDANQSFREAVARAAPAGSHPDLRLGPNEMDFATLRRQIEDLERTRDGAPSARRLEYTYQLRLAIAVAALPLGLAGLLVSIPRRGRYRALAAIGVLVSYWTVMAYEQLAVNASIDGGGFLPEYLCAWTPNAVLLLVATATLLSRRFLQPPPARSFRGA